MKTLYAVEWIEVEYGWGNRPEGFQVFDNLDQCIEDTKRASDAGNYTGGNGYCGPVRPLAYREAPDDGTITEFPCFVDKLHFKSDPISIQ